MIDRLVKRSEATRATGLGLDALKAAAASGLLRIVPLNSRDFRIPESDLHDLAAKLSEHSRRETMATERVNGVMSAETEQGLIKIFGYVPGAGRRA